MNSINLEFNSPGRNLNLGIQEQQITSSSGVSELMIERDVQKGGSPKLGVTFATAKNKSSSKNLEVGSPLLSFPRAKLSG